MRSGARLLAMGALCALAVGCEEQDVDPIDRVRNGMTIPEVQEIMGESAEETFRPFTEEEEMLGLDVPPGTKPQDVEAYPYIQVGEDDSIDTSIVFFLDGKVVGRFYAGKTGP